MTAQVSVKVKDGWVVCDGHTQRTAGEAFDVPAEVAEEWERAGWAERHTKPRRQPAKRT